MKKFAQRWPRLHLSIQMVANLLTAALVLAFLFGWLRPHDGKPTEPESSVLVLVHPVLGPIDEAGIRAALPAYHHVAQRVDVAPLRKLGPGLDAVDWPKLAAEQAAQVSRQVVPRLHTSPVPQIAYFGLAPVPLAIALGAQLSGLAPVSVHLRRHDNQSWQWPQSGRTQEVLTNGLPCAPRPGDGDVVLRVSTSFLIDPKDTRAVVKDVACEIDVRLQTPDPDGLRSEEDVLAVAAAVRQVLNSLRTLDPDAQLVHLFAAVPVGLALQLGMAISPTVHPAIQTYYFESKRAPRYDKALLLNRTPGKRIGKEDAMPAKSTPLIEKRIERFVDWLKPESDTEETMRRQADEIRQRVRSEAAADRLTVRSTPGAGSFAKNTGLRRHVTGGSAVDGQDVDIPFVLSPLSPDERRIGRLLDRFQGYADRAYPQRPPYKSRSKSSIKISFEGNKLSYDLVPMLIAEEYGDDYQLLLRGDGTERLTSVARHNEFIRRRTRDSNLLPGRVKFNECVRLLKWWREFRMAQDRRSIPGVPSIVIDMLAAHAYDNKKVQATYSETLRVWFDYLYGIASKRQRITFTDYPPPRGRRHATPSTWQIIDPVDPENNLTHDWIAQHVDELADWLRQGRDNMQRAIDLDRNDNPQESLHHLVRLFGPPFKHHCDAKGPNEAP